MDPMRRRLTGHDPVPMVRHIVVCTSRRRPEPPSTRAAVRTSRRADAERTLAAAGLRSLRDRGRAALSGRPEAAHPRAKRTGRCGGPVLVVGRRERPTL